MFGSALGLWECSRSDLEVSGNHLGMLSERLRNVCECSASDLGVSGSDLGVLG